MLYSEKLKFFAAAHPCQTKVVSGATYRYVLSGQPNGRTLVFLNGGMNTLEMWMDYVDALGSDNRVLLFDYPQEVRTNQALVAGMRDFFRALDIQRPILVGASDGSMVAQIYVQKFPNETGRLILMSAGGMDERTLKSLKKQYFFAPLMLWYMKHCNYEKLKPRLIKASMRHICNENADEIACAQDMFETLFKDFKQNDVSGTSESVFSAIMSSILLLMVSPMSAVSLRNSLAPSFMSCAPSRRSLTPSM